MSDESATVIAGPVSLEELPDLDALGGGPGSGSWKVAGQLSFILGAALFYWRLSPDVAFNQWQGPLLSMSEPESLPLVSWSIGRAMRALVGPASLNLTNLLTAIFGAACCGIVAAVCASSAERITDKRTGIVAGVFAAGLFASTPTMLLESTALGPAATTLLLTLLSVFLAAAHIDSAKGMSAALFSGVFAGLAAANNPSLAYIGLICFAVFLVRPVPTGRPYRLSLVFASASLPGLLLPLMVSLARGQSVGHFLEHALFRKFPGPGGAAPDWLWGAVLLEEYQWPALVFMTVGLTAFFWEHTRAQAVLIGVIALVFGPLLPFLVNPVAEPAPLIDDVAATLVALAMACIFAGWGLCAIWSVLTRHFGSSLPRSLGVFASAAVLLAFSVSNAPSRAHTLALELGWTILEDCPADPIIVPGNPTLASVIAATQVYQSIRVDADLAPAWMLTDARMRSRLSAQLAPRALLLNEFPGPGAWERWARERPRELGALLEKTASHETEAEIYSHLALWDFVRDNMAYRPVCLVGATAPWTSARAHLQNSVLVYPTVYDHPPRQTMLEFGDAVLEEASSDPSARRAAALLLESLASAARKQQDLEFAEEAAELVRELLPAKPSALMPIARVMARSGRTTEAMDYARQLVEASEVEAAVLNAGDVLEDDLRCFEMADLVMRLLKQNTSETVNLDEIAHLTKPLWDAEEYTVLAGIYSYVVEKDWDNVEALYLRAATLAELGDFRRADVALERAIRLAPRTIPERVVTDNHFVMYHLYQQAHERGATDRQSGAIARLDTGGGNPHDG